MKNKMDLIKMNSYLSQDVMKRTLSSSSNDANPKAISYLPNVPNMMKRRKAIMLNFPILNRKQILSMSK